MLSHTATGEWQSFELRMRRRRAERLALRAEAAASAGFEDDARVCLAEARTLAPDLPEIALVEAALARPPEPLIPIEETESARRSPFIAVAAVCILLVAFAGGWIVYRDAAGVPDVLPAQVEAGAVPDSASAPAAAEPDPVPAPVHAASDPSITRVEPPLLAAEKKPAAAVAVNPPSVGTGEGLPALPDVPAAAPVAPPAPRVEPPPAVTPEAPTAGLAGTVLPAPSVDVKAPVVEASQEPLVQAVLNRYAAAYSSLDADAAARVWPTVNRDALARAFDGLETQAVRLGECRIDVTGNKASARCAGSATWSPKVGSGTHTESRDWTFDLVRVGANWQILNARAQNR